MIEDSDIKKLRYVTEILEKAHAQFSLLCAKHSLKDGEQIFECIFQARMILTAIKSKCEACNGTGKVSIYE